MGNICRSLNVWFYMHGTALTRSVTSTASILVLTMTLLAFSMAPGQAPKKKVKKPVAKATNAALIKQGSQVYGKFCVVCHGANGIGDDGPKLSGIELSDGGITSTVKNGRKGGMPSFTGKIKDGEIKAVIAYIRSLKK